ncbi:MAG: hypothetical protein IJU76_13445 [Desulfovibrionaceae bacterium]|nr:hypothetical protein [Desulfovibrionaceae bacterium]
MTKTRDLILGPMPYGADPKCVLAMGPWCFAGREAEFPDFEKRFTLAPEPKWSDAQEPLRAVTALCQRTLGPLADTLAPGNNLPAIYWETLLLPSLAQVCEQIVERWQRIVALKERFSTEKLRIEIRPIAPDFAFVDEEDFTLRGALGTEYNTWLFSILLAQSDLPPLWECVSGPMVAQTKAREKKKSFRARFRALIRCLPFPHLKGVSLFQSLLFSLALLHTTRTPDRSHPLYENAGAGDSLKKLGLTFDPMPIIRASCIRSLTDLAHPRAISRTKHPRLRCASIAAYEDASYRQSLAIARAKGHRLFFVQHGGNYGQVRTHCRTALVEYSQHCFITWGWSEYADTPCRFLPLPYPQLARIKNAHVERTDTILFVGTEMPLYNYRLDSHPNPTEMLDYRAAKKRFLDALPKELQRHVVYRPYFPLPSSLEDYPWLARAHPGLARCTGPLTDHLLASKLLVLDHHGTTLLEAMAANVPLVLYFAKDQWQLTDTCLAYFEELFCAGIWFATPEACAQEIAAIWPDIQTWWQAPKRQNARARFVKQYAQTSKTNETALWRKTLKNL